MSPTDELSEERRVIDPAETQGLARSVTDEFFKERRQVSPDAAGSGDDEFFTPTGEPAESPHTPEGASAAVAPDTARKMKQEVDPSVQATLAALSNGAPLPLALRLFGPKVEREEDAPARHRMSRCSRRRQKSPTRLAMAKTGKRRSSVGHDSPASGSRPSPRGASLLLCPTPQRGMRDVQTLRRREPVPSEPRLPLLSFL